MFHYRDLRKGEYYLDPEVGLTASQREVMPFLRFAGQKGFADDLWTSTRPSEYALVGMAGLDWPVQSRPVLTPNDDDGFPPMEVPGYQALVRPDENRVMSVVTSSYRVAENRAVVRAAVAVGRQFDQSAALVGAAGFGRSRERSIFIVRVHGTAHRALVLLAYNSHGGEGAVRFQLVEADRDAGTVLTPDTGHASISIPHVGDMKERLESLLYRKMVEHYEAEVRPIWHQLQSALWTPRHTRSLLGDLWREQANLDPDRARRHPGRHLTSVLSECSDAANAYRSICAYLDNESEACERGDFTKDRDERLTVGAGLKMKQRAWRWIVANT